MAKLILTTKSGRHRKEHTFDIDDAIAQDPIQRAAVITAKKALFNNVVNQRVEF